MASVKINQGAWQLYDTTVKLNQGAWQGWFDAPSADGTIIPKIINMMRMRRAA